MFVSIGDAVIVSMVLGVPTIKRERESYLSRTLQSLIESLSEDESLECLIVVMVFEVRNWSSCECLFICSFVSIRTSLFVLWLVFVFCIFPLCYYLVVSTSAIDCLKRLVLEMTYYVLSGTLNPTHSLACTHLVTTVKCDDILLLSHVLLYQSVYRRAEHLLMCIC